MADVIERTGKTIELALKAALDDLGVSEEEVTYEVLERPTKGFFGFGAKPARIRVTRKEVPLSRAMEEPREEVPEASPAEAMEEDSTFEAEEVERDDSLPLRRTEEFLRGLFSAMGIDVAIERKKTGEGYVYDLSGEKLGILIGKHGQTLDALQYLANLAANRGLAEERIRVILDVEKYRKRREDTLRKLASRLAEKAIRIREEVKLEPMNRHERKIIHMALQENRRVSTYSAGDEPFRYVVIVPKRPGRREREKNNAEC